MYRSLAFYLRSKIDEGIVEGYNSRPRDMINTVLQEIQCDKITIEQDILNVILDKTLKFRSVFAGAPNADYIIDSLIPFVNYFDGSNDETIARTIFENVDIKKTFEKSPATTSNVNKRLTLVRQLITEKQNGNN